MRWLLILCLLASVGCRLDATGESCDSANHTRVSAVCVVNKIVFPCSITLCGSKAVDLLDGKSPQDDDGEALGKLREEVCRDEE